MADELAAVDVVVASTSARASCSSTSELGEAIRAAAGGRCSSSTSPCRGRRSGACRLDGCFVYDIDDLEAVVEASLAGRRAEAVRAERVVAGEAERFREWQASLAVVPRSHRCASWRRTFVRTSSTARRDRLGRLPERDRRLVESVTAQIVNKLLHEPTVRMKEAAVTAEGWSMLRSCGTYSGWATRSAGA